MVFFGNCLEDIGLFVGPLIPPFWTSVLDFKARVDPLTCMLHHLCAMDSSDSPLVQHLLISWQPAIPIPVHANKHWWGLSLACIMPAASQHVTSRWSTKWAMLWPLLYPQIAYSVMAAYPFPTYFYNVYPLGSSMAASPFSNLLLQYLSSYIQHGSQSLLPLIFTMFLFLFSPRGPWGNLPITKIMAWQLVPYNHLLLQCSLTKIFNLFFPFHRIQERTLPDCTAHKRRRSLQLPGNEWRH